MVRTSRMLPDINEYKDYHLLNEARRGLKERPYLNRGAPISRIACPPSTTI